MDELVKNVLKKISNKSDEELAQMSFYELIDILLILESAKEQAENRK